MTASGTTTIDFGAFPGKADTTVTVTGQADIVAGSLVGAWIRPVATADHSSDEHIVEGIQIVASDIIAGTGFTIYATEASPVTGPMDRGVNPDLSNEGHRLYGQFTVAWAWV